MELVSGPEGNRTREVRGQVRRVISLRRLRKTASDAAGSQIMVGRDLMQKRSQRYEHGSLPAKLSGALPVNTGSRSRPSGM